MDNVETFMRFQPIRRLLKKKDAAEYYAGHGLWTDDPDRAMNFPNGLDITREVCAYQLQDRCVLLLQFRDKKIAVEVPL